ncbi:hypothetical protein [Thermococcus thioreducens]|uniref:Dolichyl-phosphate-mannose-protein mannosyltransferase n=1 Tax=Thermococcus thioreducens TaxID=277988 RepID=A0A0Q2QTE9_9EURY|nr:hypothetical protein [Thermococcus thioreducens]KQH83285.1 hypothetical protein AMR53_00995 [Thermococcus thioreducens]SEW22376.1 hypothetical protein SAMN05216170_2226 [Thermococcus thioreducens]
MKRALILIAFILTVALPLVSAETLSYYPNQSAFQAFLDSNSSYTIVAGNESWARGWAYYIDERLHTIKPHGNDTLVLVGNVYNNPLMMRVWNRTGLSENASLLPSIIVLNDTVLITGSKDNIYMTERAFEGLWNPPRSSVVAFSSISFLIFMIFLVCLSRDNSHAGSFYLLASSLLGLWYLTAERPVLTEGFLRYLFQGLEFATGGAPGSPLGAIIGATFRVVAPIEENIVFIHWTLILLILSFSFYLAPKRARELGFMIFGLIFVSPMFRENLYHINGSTLGLAALAIVLAIISNVAFSPEKWKALLQTFILSIFTLLTIAINPYLVLIPIIFVLTFPKRHLRNYAYLMITSIGVFLMYTQFGMPPGIPKSIDPSGWRYLERFLFNSSLALTAMAYTALKGRRRIKMRGQTAFLLLMTMVYLPIALFVPPLFPYCFILLAALTIRMIHSFTP